MPRARLSTLTAKVKKRPQNECQAGILAKKPVIVKIFVPFVSSEVNEGLSPTAVESTSSHAGISRAGLDLSYGLSVESSKANPYTAEQDGPEHSASHN